jgi:cell division protein FtsW
VTARQPAPVTGSPPVRNRRNSELLLLVFAAVITAVALLIVEVNQRQPLGRDLARYVVIYVGVFAVAHAAIRRFAAYADPVLLPGVALLNGLGLVMIHRLDLSAVGVASPAHRESGADQQMPWTVLGVVAFVLVVGVLKEHRILARYGYICGMTGLVLLAIPALLPASVSEQNGAKIWVRLAGLSIEPAEFAKLLLLIFVAAVLVAKRGLFTSAGTHLLGMTVPRPLLLPGPHPSTTPSGGGPLRRRQAEQHLSKSGRS